MLIKYGDYINSLRSSIATTFPQLQLVKPKQKSGNKIVRIRVKTECVYLQDMQIVNIPSTQTLFK